MITYKRVITCPHSVEVEIYNSFREVGKSYGGRGVNRSLSPEKQRKANEIRTVRKWERVIDCNFDERGYFCRFSAPYGTFAGEKEFRRETGNFFKRIKYRCDKAGLEFKYIGFIECGKSGKNWHMHIVLSAEVAQIARKCWHWPNGGINLSPLWENHSYEKLAAYIRKDVTSGSEDAEVYPAKKRMMASRNLKRPEVTVQKCKRSEIRKLERGEYMDPPEGFYMVKDELNKTISDVTGAAYYFKFCKIEYERRRGRGRAIGAS